MTDAKTSISMRVSSDLAKLEELGEYNDTARSILNLTRSVLALAERLEALEQRLAPFLTMAEDAAAMECRPPSPGD